MIIRNILVILCLNFGFFPCASQKIDSLKALLPGAEGEERVEVLYELARSHISIDNRVALEYGSQAFHLAVALNDSFRIVNSGLVMASALRRLEMIDSAMVINNVVLRISRAKNYTDKLAIVLNGIGIINSFKAQYDKALQFYFESLVIREAMGDSAGQTMVSNNIATVYYKLKDFRKALRIFLRNIDDRESNGEIGDYQTLLNIAHCYAYLNEDDQAIAFVKRAVSPCGATCSEYVLLQADFVRGIVLFGNKSWDSAEHYFLGSLKRASSLNDIRFMLDNIDYLARIYIVQDRRRDAVFYLNTAESIIKRYDDYNLEKIKILGRMAELYWNIKDFEKAAHYQLRYSQLKDSVYNEQMTTKLMEFEAEFLERRNVAVIDHQRELIRLKESIIAQERLINKIMILLAVMFALCVFFLFRSYRQKRNLSALLERKVAERTLELQNSRDHLMRVFRERDIVINKTFHVVAQTVRSITSLCHLGKRETSNAVANIYLTRIQRNSTDLAGYIEGQARGSFLSAKYE